MHGSHSRHNCGHFGGVAQYGKEENVAPPPLLISSLVGPRSASRYCVSIAASASYIADGDVKTDARSFCAQIAYHQICFCLYFSTRTNTNDDQHEVMTSPGSPYQRYRGESATQAIVDEGREELSPLPGRSFERSGRRFSYPRKLACHSKMCTKTTFLSFPSVASTTSWASRVR